MHGKSSIEEKKTFSLVEVQNLDLTSLEKLFARSRSTLGQSFRLLTLDLKFSDYRSLANQIHRNKYDKFIRFDRFFHQKYVSMDSILSHMRERLHRFDRNIKIFHQPIGLIFFFYVFLIDTETSDGLRMDNPSYIAFQTSNIIS